VTVSYTGSVPDYCTCGAQLPPDARFCHKCGKPQYDYPGLEQEPAPPAPPPPPAIVPTPEISFHNRLAVRIGFVVALTSFLPFMFLQAIPFLPAVVAFLAGFLAVFSYSRLTGKSLSIRSGARMGWITGLFSFAIIAAFFTLSMIVVATQGKILVDHLRDYQGPFFHPKSDQIDAVAKLLQDPATFALSMVGVLLLFFIMLTALPVLGGALGAKVFEKE
jgi:hypothetical protein